MSAHTCLVKFKLGFFTLTLIFDASPLHLMTSQRNAAATIVRPNAPVNPAAVRQTLLRPPHI